MIHKIKSLYDDGKGLTERKIAKELGISRNTVSKYIQMPETAITEQKSETDRSKKLDEYRVFIIHLLETYPGLSAVKKMGSQKKMGSKKNGVRSCKVTKKNGVRSCKVKKKKKWGQVLQSHILSSLGFKKKKMGSGLKKWGQVLQSHILSSLGFNMILKDGVRSCERRGQVLQSHILSSLGFNMILKDGGTERRGHEKDGVRSWKKTGSGLAKSH